MKKSIKVLLSIAFILCAVGALLIGFGIEKDGREDLRENVSNAHTYSQEKTPLDGDITELEVDFNFAKVQFTRDYTG